MQHVESVAYAPLHPWQTRILQLHPGNGNEPIVCDLLVADLISFEGFGVSSLSRIIEYEAVSYAWGPPHFSDAITCNETLLTITPRLANALKHLRYHDKVRYLWIDALCINQRNISEKNQQVKLMLQIYQKARSVPVWLGMPTGHEPDTFMALAKFATSLIDLMFSARHVIQLGSDNRCKAISIMSHRSCSHLIFRSKQLQETPHSGPSPWCSLAAPSQTTSWLSGRSARGS